MTDAHRYRVANRDLKAAIRQIVLDRGLQAGDPMPTETTLTELLGVSRGSLREALKSLQALGIVETRHGSGSYVGSLSFAPMADGLAFHSQLGELPSRLAVAADLVDIREILETVLIRRVALSANDELISDLRKISESMAASVGMQEAWDEYNELDLDFHRRLYADLGNEIVLQLLEAFWAALSDVRSLMPEPFEERSEAARKHEAIALAVDAHDPDAAESAMKHHFALTRDWIISAAPRGTATPV